MIDAHPGLLSTDLSPLYIVQIQLFRVEFTRRGTAAVGPDPVLPIELQVMSVVGGIDGNKFIGFGIVVTELHVVTASEPARLYAISTSAGSLVSV